MYLSHFIATLVIKVGYSIKYSCLIWHKEPNARAAEIPMYKLILYNFTILFYGIFARSFVVRCFKALDVVKQDSY